MQVMVAKRKHELEAKNDGRLIRHWENVSRARSTAAQERKVEGKKDDGSKKW